MVIALTLVVILGLGSREFGDSLPRFLAENSGDALWTVAVYLSLAIIAPRWSTAKLFLLAFLISVMVELSQLFDFAPLNAIRATLPGRLLLGAGFLPIDLVRYLAGALLAVLLDSIFIKRRSANSL